MRWVGSAAILRRLSEAGQQHTTLQPQQNVWILAPLAGREDNRRVSNGDQVNRMASLAMRRSKSVDFHALYCFE
jgi:hypothetical protein